MQIKIQALDDRLGITMKDDDQVVNVSDVTLLGDLGRRPLCSIRNVRGRLEVANNIDGGTTKMGPALTLTIDELRLGSVAKAAAEEHAGESEVASETAGGVHIDDQASRDESGA